MPRRFHVLVPSLLLAVSLGGCALDGADEAASTEAPLVAGRGLDALAAGRAHACLVQSTGRAMCWGANGAGQLGDGSTDTRTTPVAMTGVANAIAVAAGDAFTCALASSGQVLCAGANDAGQLGRGSYGASQPVAAPVYGLTDAVAITAAGAHACALRADGTAVCWGQGSRGQLGAGTYAASAWPLTVIATPALVELDAGAEHTCGLDAAGATWCWGAHDGVSSSAFAALVSTTSSRELTAGLDGTCALDASGRATCWGRSAPLLGTTSWRAIDRAAHVCAVTGAGAVQCVGDNAQGQLGDGTTTGRSAPVPVLGVTEVVRVALGDGFSCAQHAGGSVSCWGRGAEGQLGDGLTEGRPVARLVSDLSGGWDRAIAIGPHHSCSLSAGTARCSGSGTSGQLGDGRSTSSSGTVVVATDVELVDVAIANSVSIGLGADGALYAWGSEYEQQFGDGPTRSAATSPVSTGVSGPFVQVSSAGSYACALSLSGSVQCWGNNLAYGYSEGIFMAGAAEAVVDRPRSSGIVGALQIATGHRHVCALTSDGHVVCRGQASAGQLGDGTVSTSFYRPRAASDLTDAIQVAAGSIHTCAARANGRVACWGDNRYGQVGDGTTTTRSRPTTVGAMTARVEQVATGDWHTCALTEDGAVWCWGQNTSGQLGDGSTATHLYPMPVSGLTDAVGITAARASTCAIRATGAIVCWGENSLGQLGIGSTTDALVPTAQRAARAIYIGGTVGRTLSP